MRMGVGVGRERGESTQTSKQATASLMSQAARSGV